MAVGPNRPGGVESPEDDEIRLEDSTIETQVGTEEEFSELDLRQSTPHPGEIPSSLLDRDALAQFIDEEIHEADNERSDLITKIADWQDAYAAEPETESKNWPIRDAANLKVPVIKEVANTLMSQLLQTILTPRPRWILKDLAEEWSPFKNPLEKFLDIASDRDLDFEDKVEDWVLEGTKYGTSIIEVGHDFIEKKNYVYSEDGSKVFPTRQVTRSGPVVWNVPIQDFYIRFHEDSIADAKWVAKRLRWSEGQLKDRVASGQLKADVVEELLNSAMEGEHTEDEVREAHEEHEDTEPLDLGPFTVYEVWLSWNLDDGDDLDTEILCYYLPDTRRVASARFNPFWHGQRPFASFQFFPVEHRFYGQGVCEQILDLQQEISVIHNQRLDNAKMANLRMVQTKRMSSSLQPGDPLYTGKVIEVDEIGDVQPFQLSEIYPSTISNEQVTRSYVQRLTGLGEAQFGGARPVSRTTATAESLLLQEGKLRFDQTVRKLRKGVSRAGNLIMSVYFQFGAGDKPVLWMGEKGRVIQALFRLPRKASQGGLGLEASAPTSRLNKEQQRQNSLALFNLMVQLYEKFLQLTQGIAPDALPLVASSLVTSAKQFMFDVLERFDVTNPEDVLAGLTVLERVLPSAEDLGGVEAFERGEETAQVLNELERLEGILRETPSDAEGRGDVRSVSRDLRRVLNEEGVLGGGPQDGGTPRQITSGQ